MAVLTVSSGIYLGSDLDTVSIAMDFVLKEIIHGDFKLSVTPRSTG